MKQIAQNYRTGSLKIEEVPMPLIKKGGVLVRNHYSVISVGTERASIQISKKGYINKARERPNQVKQVIHSAKTLRIKKTYELVSDKLNTPVPFGYSSSGTVIEIGEDAYEFQVGEGVACAGSDFANHAEVIFVPKNLCAKIPQGVTFEEAAYATLGSIALQGVRQADARLGDIVAVTGLGLIGLLAVQILKAAGCVVIGIDINSFAVDKAKECGTDYAIDSNLEDIQSLIQSVTQSNGVDATIITAATSSNQPVELAGEITRKKGKVVVVGDVGMKIPRSIYYAKELDLRLSCSYGPGRYDPNYEEYGIDYPIGYVRWTEKRNMDAFLQLLRENKIDTGKVTTHKFAFDDAQDAYDLIMTKKKTKSIGILFEYDYQKEIKPIIDIMEITRPKESKISIALIGAGNFAQSTILPILRKLGGLELKAVATTRSHISQNIAKKFGFEKCYSDPSSVFTNDSINTVVITTRHNLHAPYVIEALKNMKNIYVEKPLAFAEDELRDIIRIRNEAGCDVLVGFNRRFSPHVEKCKDFFAQRTAPMFITYRVNAGFIAPDHWIQSKEEGGGRIIGEVCHFVDLCQFICDSRYKSIFAENLGDDKLRDNVTIMIKFDDGSLANVNYVSSGDNSYPKERIEIFCENAIAILDDFKKLELIRMGKRKKYKSRQDKGHQKQIELWLNSIEKGEPIPTPFIDSLNSSIATFMIHESLNTGRVVYFDEYSQKFFR